jgi:hypothetical protein
MADESISTRSSSSENSIKPSHHPPPPMCIIPDLSQFVHVSAEERQDFIPFSSTNVPPSSPKQQTPPFKVAVRHPLPKAVRSTVKRVPRQSKKDVGFSIRATSPLRPSVKRPLRPSTPHPLQRTPRQSKIDDCFDLTSTPMRPSLKRHMPPCTPLPSKKKHGMSSDRHDNFPSFCQPAQSLLTAEDFEPRPVSKKYNFVWSWLLSGVLLQVPCHHYYHKWPRQIILLLTNIC